MEIKIFKDADKINDGDVFVARKSSSEGRDYFILELKID